MGVLTRFKDIMSANINTLLDKCENPEKMVEQTLRNLERDLVLVKAETAGVIAEAMASRKKCDDNKNEIAQLLIYAQKAAKSGNDEDAKQFLAKKQQLEELQESYDAQCKIAQENADKMRLLHDKLSRDIDTAKDRAALIRAKTAVAKAQEHINNVSRNTYSMTDSVNAIGRWEDKANKRLETARAMSELNSIENPISTLKEKYGTISVTDDSVSKELAALKEKLEISSAS